MAETHPQHNFTSNFNGSEGHNAQLKLIINGVEHLYTPAGNDKVFNVPGVVRIATNLAAADLIAEIRTALDGDAFPVLVEPIPDSESEVVYQYVGQTEDSWAFSLATVNFIITVWVNIETGTITRNTIVTSGMSTVVYIDYSADNLYTRIAGTIATGQTPVIKRTVANQTTYYWPVNNTAYQEPVGPAIDHRANNGYYFIGKETTFESGTDTPINDIKMLWVRPDNTKNVSGIPELYTARSKHTGVNGLKVVTNKFGQVTELTDWSISAFEINSRVIKHVLTADDISNGYFDVVLGLPEMTINGITLTPEFVLMHDIVFTVSITNQKFNGHRCSLRRLDVVCNVDGSFHDYYSDLICSVTDFNKDEFGRALDYHDSQYSYTFVKRLTSTLRSMTGIFIRCYINPDYELGPIVPGLEWVCSTVNLIAESPVLDFDHVVTEIETVKTPNTLRFRFSDPNYTPVAAGVGTSGTWTKRLEYHAAINRNVWDWTCNNSRWDSAFENAWDSEDMDVVLVAAGDTSTVTGVLNLFRGCSSLKYAVAFDTSNVVDFYGMFYECTGLTKVPYFKTDSAINVGAMFEGCTNVRSGALALYTRMSGQATPPDYYADAFLDCGKDTTEGYAELLQIPASWGGLAP